MKEIREGVAEVLTVSKDERDRFRFTGCEVEKYDNIVRVSMKDYAQSLNEIVQIRKAYRHKKLSRIELKEYIKFT